MLSHFVPSMLFVLAVTAAVLPDSRAQDVLQTSLLDCRFLLFTSLKYGFLAAYYSEEVLSRCGILNPMDTQNPAQDIALPSPARAPNAKEKNVTLVWSVRGSEAVDPAVSHVAGSDIWEFAFPGNDNRHSKSFMSMGKVIVKCTSEAKDCPTNTVLSNTGDEHSYTVEFICEPQSWKAFCWTSRSIPAISSVMNVLL